MASATVNGIALDFSEPKSGATMTTAMTMLDSASQPHSPASAVGYDDSAGPHEEESPYQELSAEDDDGPASTDHNNIGADGNSNSSKRPATDEGPDDDEDDDAKREAVEAAMSTTTTSKKRRKQSNPVRIASSRELDADPEPQPRLPGRNDDDDDVDDNDEVLDDDDDNNVGEHDDDCPLDLAEGSSSPAEGLYKCPDCSALFGVEEHLRLHVEEEHVQKLLERQLQQQQQQQHQHHHLHHGLAKGCKEPFMGFKDSDLSDFAMSFQSILQESNKELAKSGIAVSGSQLQVPACMSQDGKATMGPLTTTTTTTSALPPSLAFGPSPFLLPMISQGPTPPPSTPTGPPIRIFNPEAYCEICNKEFCNKYFLKTHKANKHGIYSMEAVSGSSPYAGAFLAANMNAAAASLSMRSLLPTVSSSGTSCGDGSTKCLGASNAEAYCEICQKAFCNKYFLRKHKQKIHGIYEQPSTPVSTSSNVNGGVATMSPANLLDSPISNGSSGSVASATNSNVDSVSDLCSKTTVQSSKYSPLQGPPPPPPPPPLPLPPNTTTTTMTTTTSPMTFPSPCSSSSIPFLDDEKGCISYKPDFKTTLGIFTPDKLREIGVINADAFCEICCKEFCNKYFLRTHKLNKHGIVIPETSNGGKSNSPNSLPPCPESLKMALGDDKMFLTSSGTNSLDGHPLEEGSSDLCCDVCGRPFASVYLLKMHKFYSHNIPAQERELAAKAAAASKSPDSVAGAGGGGSIKEEMLQRDAPENLVKTEISNDHAGEDLRKLQSMIQELNAPIKEAVVVCIVCQKEMENKYFLRAHMMNEHGMLHNEDQPPNNASKDQSKFPLSLPPVLDSETSCDICKKDFGTKYFLHIHKTNVHSAPMDLSMPQHGAGDSAGCNVTGPLKPPADPTMPTLTPISNDRPTVITGRNYCEICNKELCNKYFMKTHMLKMHGINVEDRAGNIKGAATIGGVTCDICQKELCSKYFLKVHKQNTHGIFEENSLSGKENAVSVAVHPAAGDKETGGVMPGEITDDNSRYYSHYAEICPICDRRFKSIKWLKTHMASDHIDQLKEFNLAPGHTSTTSSSSCPDMLGKNCLICGKTFVDAVHLQVHMITTHYSSQAEQPILDPVELSHSLSFHNNLVHDLSSDPKGHKNPPLAEGPMHKVRIGNGTKVYHCSYCAYATRWLSNLYAHEKRHVGLVNDADKKFPCRLCPRAYRYNHSLQRHMLSHRGTLPRVLAAAAAAAAAASPPSPSPSAGGPLANPSSSSSPPLPLLPPPKFPLQPPGLLVPKPNHPSSPMMALPDNGDAANVNGLPGTNNDARRVKKYRCSKCMIKFRSHKCCVAHIRQVHNPRTKGPLVTAIVQKGIKIYKCRKCGFNTRHLSILKQHIRQQHRDLLNPHSQEARASISAALRKNRGIAGSSAAVAGTGPRSKLHHHHHHHHHHHQQLQQQQQQRSKDLEQAPLLQPQTPPSDAACSAFLAASEEQLQQAAGNSTSSANTQFPMTYAMPQNPPSAGSFIMQPFLMAQPSDHLSSSLSSSSTSSSSAAGLKEDGGTFVPSLVYLPVCQKVSEPVTIAFTLTPA